jgi:Ni/Fe-hydrogenase subunit HybB-like protein
MNEFVALEGKSRGYRVLAAVLAALALAGFIAFIVSYIEGHQVFGGSNIVPWGMPIVLAIYLIGLSTGSLILSSLTYVFGKEEYRPVARIAVFLAIALVFGAMLSIAIDLGRPEKFWRLFMFFYLNNMKSMFAINGVLYGGYLVISLFYLGVIFSGRQRVTRVTGAVAAGWAAVVPTGSGAILGFIAAREAWYSSIRPLEFLFAALTSGVAVLIVAATLTFWRSGRRLDEGMLKSLGRLLVYLIGVLVVLIILDKLTHLYSPARDAAIYTLAGQYAWIFWVLQVGLGVIVPLAVLLASPWRGTVRGVFIAAASVIIGVFFERFYIVISGAAYPLQIYPGDIQGVWGLVGSFPLKPAEIILSVGIVSFAVLLFILGLKYLELLPARETAASNEGNEKNEA